MARIRTVKPEFWQHEELANLPAETRLLAIGLLNHSDDEGYFRANHKLIKAAVFPFSDDSVSVQCMLISLQKIDYIRLAIGTDGKPYGFVTNFTKHQRVNRPQASQIKVLCAFTEYSLINHGAIIDASVAERKGKERNREQGREHDIPQAAPEMGEVEAVFSYWCYVMAKTDQAKLTPKRSLAVRNILKQGYTVNQIKKAIDGCRRSPHHMGVNKQRTVYDDLELICRSGEKLEAFISNTGSASGVETIDMTQDRIEQQAERVAAYLQEYQS
ncbi:MAG: hypothetical protein V4563_17490 [Pseudomonadota bacterium]